MTQKNGSPGHPQMQGKIERLHQTQKKYLAALPPARTVAELQRQLDTFRVDYNEHRPHRALNRATPTQAYHATPKALPAAPGPVGHYRIRYDRVDPRGKMSIRRAGRMHHLGIGAEHAGKRVIALADDTGEIIATNEIQPDKTYWRNTQKAPGRWPGAFEK